MTTAADEPIRDEELDRLISPPYGRRLALAVSGGVDSMVLMHLLARWLSLPAGIGWIQDGSSDPAFLDGTDFKPGPPPVGMPSKRPRFAAEAEWMSRARNEDGDAQYPPVVVLTVDHGLRPESGDEAAHVATEATRLGFPHQTLVWPEGPKLRGSTGLQERAREGRYKLIADATESELWTLWLGARMLYSPLESDNQRRLVVTAHHRDDLIETFLMRLKRGSGLDGLASIRTFQRLNRLPEPARPYPAKIDLWRPLLDLPKSRLVATAHAMGISWREDPSNQDAAYERTTQRRDMPAMAALGFPASALHLSIRRLQRAHEVVEQQSLFRMRGLHGHERVVDHHCGLFATVNLMWATSEPPSKIVNADTDAELQLQLLADTITAIGGSPEPPELAQLEALRRHLWNCWRAGDGGAVQGSGRTLGGCQIDYYQAPGAGRGLVRIWREAGRDALPALRLEPGDGAWWDNRFAVSVTNEAKHAVVIRALGGERWKALKRRLPSLSAWRGLPPGALETMPAVWGEEGEFVSLPFLDALPASLSTWLRREIEHEWGALNGLSPLRYRIEFSPALLDPSAVRP